MAAAEGKLEAQVLTPEGEVYSGELFMLSTKTTEGEVGIRAHHAPMVARLVANELRLHVDENETIRYAQGEGWLEVFANKALVLVSEAIEPGKLEVAELRERLSEAEKRHEEADQGSAAREQAQEEIDRLRAFVRIAENR